MVKTAAEILAGLDAAEQDKLYELLAFKRANSKAQPTRIQQMFWELICGALDMQRPLPLAPFMTSYGKAKFDAKAADLAEFIDNGCGAGLLRLPVRQAVGERIIRALVSYMKTRDIVCTPTTVLNSFVMLADAADSQYPGYAKARLLHRLAPIKSGPV